MAGYPGTPQSTKLGIKPGMRVALVAAPKGWALTDPPDFEPAGAGPAEVIVAFVRAAVDLSPLLPELGRRIFPAGAAWIAWPRKAAGHVCDLTDNIIRASALPLGLVDVKVAAIDDDWSGLKLVWRVENRR